ncbi:MAG: hypothetical protein A2284_03485 [Deltaproteobacteria bacterium RIFOXYA12_FULL_61_11]|nr:MAG: hypothetical protein A2284_03485 [Deltaproteobacteria bacterium RIFOXYA12_FULL_61_11]
MIPYLDSSVALRHLLGQPGKLDLPLERPIYTSEILFVECARVLDRVRLLDGPPAAVIAARLTALQRLRAALKVVALDRAVLQRAGEAFATPLRTLDAIHLATALLLSVELGEACEVLTHDHQLGHAALAHGLEFRCT